MTWDVIAGSIWFQAAGLTVSEVRTACKAAVAQSADVSEDFLECSVQRASARRLRELQAAVVWTASFVIAVQADVLSIVQDRIETLINTTTLAEVLLERLLDQVQNATLLDNTFTFGGISLTDSAGAVNNFLFSLARTEAKALDSLLEGNETQVIVDTGTAVTVATAISSDDLEEDGGATVEADGAFTVFVPLSTFEELGVENLVLLVSDVGNSLGALMDNTAEEAPTEVQATLTISLYSDDGAYLQVSNLSEPLQFSFTVASPEQLQCAVWDEELQVWMTDAIIQVGAANGTLLCATRHLSVFGAIAGGFLSAYKCTQADLLSAAGLAGLLEGDWVWQFTTFLCWLVFACLVALLTAGIMLDCRRHAKGTWHDSLFLIPVSPMPLNDFDDTSPRGHSLTGCLLWMRAMCIEAYEVVTTAARDVADEILAAVYSYLDAVRSFCEAILTLISDARNQHGGLNHDCLLALLMVAGRAAMQRTAYLNACAATGIHQSDDIRKVVTEVRETESSTRPSLATVDLLGVDTNRTKNSGETQTTRENESECGESVSSDGEEYTYHASTPATPSASSGPSPPITHGQVHWVSRPSQASGGKHTRRSMSRAGESSTPSNTTIKRQRTLAELEYSTERALQEQEAKMHNIGYVMYNVCKQFIYHGPVGSVFVFSIHSPSSVRALLLLCDVLGAFAVATFFMSVSGKSRGINNPSECQDDGLWRFLGRFLALGIASALLAKLPVLLISKLHSRKFIKVEFEGCRAWHAHLRAWWLKDALLWLMGLGYSCFCALYVLLFFANVLPGEHLLWLTSAGTIVIGDLILAPLATIIIPPMTLVFCIMLIAFMTSSSRKESVKMMLIKRQGAQMFDVSTDLQSIRIETERVSIDVEEVVFPNLTTHNLLDFDESNGVLVCEEDDVGTSEGGLPSKPKTIVFTLQKNAGDEDSMCSDDSICEGQHLEV